MGKSEKDMKFFGEKPINKNEEKHEETESIDQLTNHIENFILHIENRVIEKQKKLAVYEVDEIVNKLLLKLDKIISDKIRVHIKFLTDNLLEKLKINGEE